MTTPSPDQQHPPGSEREKARCTCELGMSARPLSLHEKHCALIQEAPEVGVHKHDSSCVDRDDNVLDDRLAPSTGATAGGRMGGPLFDEGLLRILSAGGCQCDPPGVGEEFCTGHCHLRAEVAQLRADLALAQAAIRALIPLIDALDQAQQQQQEVPD